MQHSSANYRPFATDGPLFHIVGLHESYQSGPRGVYISDDYILQNPVLWTVERNGVTYYFRAVNPLDGLQPGAPRRALSAVTGRMHNLPKSGHPTEIHVYAAWKSGIDQTRSLVERAIGETADSPDITGIAHQLLTDGHALSSEFVKICRSQFLQYWLEYPMNPLQWTSVSYYSIDRNGWYLIRAAEDYAPPSFDLERVCEFCEFPNGLNGACATRER